MQLIVTYHHNLQNLQTLAPALTWPIVIGGLYGGVRLVIDAFRLFRAIPGNYRDLRLGRDEDA